jgi:hypothetical protein
MNHIDRINAIIGEEEKKTYSRPMKIFPYKTDIKPLLFDLKNKKCYNCSYYMIYNNTDRCIINGRLNEQCSHFEKELS